MRSLVRYSLFSRGRHASTVLASLLAIVGLLAINPIASAAPTTSFSEPTGWTVGDLNSTSQQWWAVSGASPIGSNLLHTDNPVIPTAPTIAPTGAFVAGSGGYYSFSANYKVTATIPSYTDPSALGTYVRVQTAASLNPDYDPENDGTGGSILRDSFKILAPDNTPLATSSPEDVLRTLYVEEFESSFGIVQYEELLWEVFLPGFTGDFKVETTSMVHSSFQSLRVDSFVQPVPEPATLTLGGAAGVALVALRRKLRKKSIHA